MRSSEVVDTLRRADYFRRPFTPMAEDSLRKEWQHFVLHTPGLRLIVNYSVNDRMTSDGVEFDPRTIVIACTDDGTTAMVQRCDPEEAVMGPVSADAWLGTNRMHTTGEGYVAAFGDQASACSGIVRFEPDAQPFVVNNQAIAPNARLSWLFVPRMRASGHVRIGDRHYVFEDAPSYHDHNWGTFRWGDDFGWEWACFLPSGEANPWTAIYMRITDARAMSSRGQALYLWKGSQSVGLWRNRQIDVELFGAVRKAPECVVPPIAKLLRQGRRCDIPERVSIQSAPGNMPFRLEYTPTRYSQVVLPNEVEGRGTVVLNETHGPAHLHIQNDAGDEESFPLEGTYEYVRH